MTIRDRLQLAGQALLGMLDPENELMPTGGAEVAHDLGRWWDAALRMEAAIVFPTVRISKEMNRNVCQTLGKSTSAPRS